MEKKVLRWMTVLLGFITVFVCVSLYHLPSFKEQWIMAAEITDTTIGQTVIEIEESEVEIEAAKQTKAKELTL